MANSQGAWHWQARAQIGSVIAAQHLCILLPQTEKINTKNVSNKPDLSLCRHAVASTCIVFRFDSPFGFVSAIQSYITMMYCCIVVLLLASTFLCVVVAHAFCFFFFFFPFARRAVWLPLTCVVPFLSFSL
jgi:hypothetical protein